MPAPVRWDGSREQIERVLGADNLAELLFYTKSTDWEYERELRMIGNPRIADEHALSPDGQDIRLFRFPAECLQEIIFGIRTPSTERKRLTDLVKARFNEVRVFAAPLNDERFDLDISRLN